MREVTHHQGGYGNEKLHTIKVVMATRSYTPSRWLWQREVTHHQGSYGNEKLHTIKVVMAHIQPKQQRASHASTKIVVVAAAIMTL